MVITQLEGYNRPWKHGSYFCNRCLQSKKGNSWEVIHILCNLSKHGLHPLQSHFISFIWLVCAQRFPFLFSDRLKIRIQKHLHKHNDKIRDMNGLHTPTNEARFYKLSYATQNLLCSTGHQHKKTISCTWYTSQSVQSLTNGKGWNNGNSRRRKNNGGGGGGSRQKKTNLGMDATILNTAGRRCSTLSVATPRASI